MDRQNLPPEFLAALAQQAPQGAIPPPGPAIPPQIPPGGGQIGGVTPQMDAALGGMQPPNVQNPLDAAYQQAQSDLTPSPTTPAGDSRLDPAMQSIIANPPDPTPDDPMGEWDIPMTANPNKSVPFNKFVYDILGPSGGI